MITNSAHVVAEIGGDECPGELHLERTFVRRRDGGITVGPVRWSLVAHYGDQTVPELDARVSVRAAHGDLVYLGFGAVVSVTPGTTGTVVKIDGMSGIIEAWGGAA